MEEIQTFWTLLDKYNIDIPIIQRDYAQGRANNVKAAKVRDDFLSAIKEKLDKSESLHLDFIYGCMQGNNLVLLDGQQRLTTLFLLYWYTAVKEKNHNQEIVEKLKKFKYQTRPTSERFCSNLAEFCPDLSVSEKSVGELIKDQPWFFIAWENDPTIVSMLNMLNEIDKRLRNATTGYFNLLASGKKINFHFLDLDRFRLSDSLYIKMNARGKPLTEFENFKAGYEARLSGSAQKQKYFAIQADLAWTEMFWNESKEKCDEAFMRYIDYIAEVGFYLSSEETVYENNNKVKYDILARDEYRDLLFKSLDAWFAIKDKAAYFEKYFSNNEYEEGKVCLFEDNVNLFSRCINKNNFDAKEKLLFFGFILQLINKKEQGRELRLLRNLLINSSNELRVENLHNMYMIIKDFFDRGFDSIDFSNMNPFNGPQIKDETAKAKFISEHPECTEDLYMLEDTKLLEGRLLAFDLKKETLSQHRKNFCDLFVDAYKTENKKTWMDIHRALLCSCKTEETYAKSPGSDVWWRFGNNNTNWKKILTLGDNPRLKESLNDLLSDLSDRTLKDIINNTLADYQGRDKDWKYYFIKYETMNIGKTGIFYWEDCYTGLYMLDKTTRRGLWWDPYLWTVYEKFAKNDKIDKESLRNFGYGRSPLKIGNLEISNAPDGNWEIKLSEEGKNRPDNYNRLRQKYSIDSSGLLSVKPSDDRIEIILQILDEIAGW
jgi:hypothetical protein